MTQEEFEGNNMIAEFVGWKLVCLNPKEKEDDRYYEYHLFNEKGEVVETHSGGDSWCWNKDQAIPFNSSWTWLMPVVEKIEQGNFGIKICRKVVEIYFDDTKWVIVNVKEDSKMKSLYKAIVEFLKWYKTQNASNE